MGLSKDVVELNNRLSQLGDEPTKPVQNKSITITNPSTPLKSKSQRAISDMSTLSLLGDD
jgi:hypothetical protein